jgi:uncharacterized protein YcbX
MSSLAALYRYPVKGLSPERLAQATLAEGAYFPADRLFALENGPSGFDLDQPAHQPKTKFLMLARHEQLARLATRYDAASGVLTLTRNGTAHRFALSTPSGAASFEAFIKAFMREDLPGGRLTGPVKLLRAPDSMRFTDSRSGFVSLINLASVADLGAKLGVTLDPLRFRGNLHLEGLPAWAEAGWVGKTLAIGAVRLEAIKPIERCAATNVNLAAASRDLNLPKALMTHYGHIDCGIYARVVQGGALHEGDAIQWQ